MKFSLEGNIKKHVQSQSQRYKSNKNYIEQYFFTFRLCGCITLVTGI